MAKNRDEIHLKFGDLKYASLKNSPKTLELANKLNDPEYWDDDKRKDLVIKILESFNGRIYNWWESRYVSKSVAIEYVKNYKR